MAAPCLHCTIREAIKAHYRDHGGRDCAGNIQIDAEDALCRLAEAGGELVALAGDRASRRKLLRFFHKAVDGAMRARAAGHPVEVASGTEH